MRKSIISKFLFICCLTGYGSDYASGNLSPKSGSGPDNSENYDVSFYFLDLNISDSSTYIRGSVSIFVFLHDVSSHQVILDMANVLVTDSVKINNSPAEFSHENNKLTIVLPAADLPDSRQVFEVFYHGLGKNSGEVSGIFNKFNSTWNKRITWTLSEPFSALNWFPCKQSLIDKRFDGDQLAGIPAFKTDAGFHPCFFYCFFN